MHNDLFIEKHCMSKAASQKISRRVASKYIGGTVAGVLMMSGTDVFLSKEALAEAQGNSDHIIAYYDLTYVYNYDLSDPRQAAMAYDHMHLVATLQGIVNRERTRLYVNFVNHDQMGNLAIDTYWLNILQAPGEWLASYRVEHISGLDALIEYFRPYIHGAVIYDPRVYATSNVASTVAGVENLVAIRYDTAMDSLYQHYVAGGTGTTTLPARTWLINRDGSSLFTGQGTIPGTRTPSSGSAKCDAYLWAKQRYLDTGRCDAGELGFYLDSYWLQHPTGAPAPQQAVLLNHDYLVSRKGFFFDLSPWSDETPVDDPKQPLGTDQRTLESILLASYHQTGGKMTAIHGFVPWGWKYTDVPPAGGSHGPVAAEWQFVQIASAYNGYLDADAEDLDAMANASFFHHYPLGAYYPQNPRPTINDLQQKGFMQPDGSVMPRRYVMFYVGDYDSAAWLYHMAPRLWNDPNRGAVPLNWAFNPTLADRMAPALVYTRGTRTANDFFIAGDSGAGYLNPGMLQEPRAFSHLPSGLDSWSEHCKRYFQQWDLSITGFVIDGNAPGLNNDGLAAYKQFSPDGLAAQKIASMGMFEGMPYTRMGIDLPRDTPEVAAQALMGALQGDTSQPPTAPEFHVFRSILESPTWHKEVVDNVHGTLPNADVEFVDAYTFYALLKRAQE